MPSLSEQLEAVMPTAITGSIVETVGMTAAVAEFPAPVGSLVQIQRLTGPPVEAEVIGFRGENTLVYPFGSVAGVRRGSQVTLRRTVRTVALGDSLLGRVIDAHGNAIDDQPQPMLADRAVLDRQPPRAVQRPRIDEPLSTGIRAIDGLLTCGKGQRMGIFAGSGVGKSVMLGMMARSSSADVNVIALIGERGREVNEFIERDLGPEGLAKSIVIVATSDEPALLRVQAAFTATTVAEYFRDQGKDVLLVMDSATRFAMAQREIGLAAGEPPTTRGYPPSVFALLPKLIERAGRTHTGSITAFYSVLVEGDDQNEPIADSLRGLLDGHTWLSRSLASRGHYPAIDILDSISRLMPEVTSAEHRDAAQNLRELLAAYRDNEDLISIGAYRRGSNRSVDVALVMLEEVNALLQQKVDEHCTVQEARDALVALHHRCRNQPTSAAVPATAGQIPAQPA